MHGRESRLRLLDGRRKRRLVILRRRVHRARLSILRPLAAHHSTHVFAISITLDIYLSRAAFTSPFAPRRRPRRSRAAPSRAKTLQSSRARSVVTTARARRPSSCRAKRARGNLYRTPIAVRARQRGWYARARPTTTNHSRCVRSTGNFKSERLERVRARWRRSCDGERRAKTSW